MDTRVELSGDDPIELFQQWFAEAQASEVNDPNAASLATSTADGHPSVRMVLVKSIDSEGFAFFTNGTSRKGQELEANPHAALCFHWKSLRRQVRVTGSVASLPEDRSDEYFHSRSRASQIGAAVSQQSHVLQNRSVMEEQVAAFTRDHEGREIERPAFWKGYRVVPDAIEFWMDGPNRLHDRRIFERATPEAAAWESVLLYP